MSPAYGILPTELEGGNGLRMTALFHLKIGRTIWETIRKVLVVVFG